MKKTFLKSLGVGIGIGIAIIASGKIADYKERVALEQERATFGTGK